MSDTPTPSVPTDPTAREQFWRDAITAFAASGLSARSAAAAGLLAHVVVSKFVDHLPLHRLESVLARHGFAASRSTLCDWVRGAAAALQPVYRAMVARVKRSYAIHADETPVTLLRPRRTAYAWAYLGDAANRFTVFDLTPGRSQEYPTRFLAGYAGFVHADAYAGYNPAHAGTRHVGCWMHARRGFHDARDADPRAADALAFDRRRSRTTCHRPTRRTLSVLGQVNVPLAGRIRPARPLATVVVRPVPIRRYKQRYSVEQRFA